MEYEWKLDIPSDEELDESSNKLMAAALYNRGIPLETARDIIEFSYEGIDQPLRLINIDKAVALIKAFLDKKDGAIYIFGDYDADGITSTTIAIRCLNHFRAMIHPEEEGGWSVSYRLPEREEGYGISETFCRALAEYEQGNEENVLVITVDNGITKKDSVSILQDAGISVLVTDHHKADYENNMTPDCVCVDPQIDEYKVGILLAGCGVIFNIMRYFEDVYLGSDHTASDDCEYLMAIGTIGDMMRMDYYHGCAVALGLKRMNGKECPSWLQEVKTQLNIRVVTSKTIGFTIAAFLNACGQAGQAWIALYILLEQDPAKRREAIQKALSVYNNVRDVTRQKKEEAVLEIHEQGLDKHAVILYGTDTEYPGIVGKIAYHLAELTNKPAIVYVKKSQGNLKGSARNSNETIPFYDLLKEAQRKGYIISANGHQFAQGCEFTQEQISQILKFMDESIESRVRTGKSTFSFKKELAVDQIIKPEDITMKNVMAIESFPFSKNWSEPSVCILDATLLEAHRSKNNEKNVCYTIQNEKGGNTDIWVWNIRPDSYDPDIHTKISLVGTLSRDFRNDRKPFFNVMDFKLA